MMWISREIFAYMGEPVYWGPWKLCVAVFSAQVLVALCFWMGRKGKFPFRTGAGDRVYTAFMGIDVFALGMVALIVWLIRQNRYPLYLLVAAGGILIFAVVVALWAREYQGLRRILPFLYLFVVLLLHGSFAGGGWVTDEWIGRGAFRAWLDKGLPEFLLLAALAIQDRKKPRGYGAPLLAIGTIAQMVCFSQREISLPFFFLLSAYLLARSGLKAGAGLKRGGRGKNGGPWFFLEENPYVYGACAYCLMGVYVFMCPFTLSYTVFRMMAVDGAYVAWLAAVKAGWGKGRKSRPLYWDVAGCVLLAGTMAGYYLKAGDLAGYNLGPVWETGDVALRLAAFAGFYRMFYRGKRSWPHLLAAAFVFPLPFALCYGHDWTQGQFYLFVLAAYGFTGIVARRRWIWDGVWIGTMCWPCCFWRLWLCTPRETGSLPACFGLARISCSSLWWSRGGGLRGWQRPPLWCWPSGASHLLTGRQCLAWRSNYCRWHCTFGGWGLPGPAPMHTGRRKRATRPGKKPG